MLVSDKPKEQASFRKPAARRLTQYDLEIEKHLSKFANGIKFNTLGLMNTNDRTGFFRLKAIVGDETYTICTVDWQNTFHNQFRFNEADLRLSAEKVDKLPTNASIFY